jgi:hypothetical protein
MQGQIVRDVPTGADRTLVNVGDLAPGIYLVQALSYDRTVATQKVRLQ